MASANYKFVYDLYEISGFGSGVGSGVENNKLIDTFVAWDDADSARKTAEITHPDAQYMISSAECAKDHKGRFRRLGKLVIAEQFTAEQLLERRKRELAIMIQDILEDYDDVERTIIREIIDEIVPKS